MSKRILNRNRWPRRAAVGVAFGAVMSGGLAAAGERADKDDAAHRAKTDTPIKHLIVFIGENRTFDHIFATYQPKHGQSVANLLSKGIIHKSGIPGPHFIQSLQYQINQPYPTKYFIDAFATKGKSPYQQSPGTPPFPVPNTAYVPTVPGGLSQSQAPFDPFQVPDEELPIIEPSLETSDLDSLRTGASGLPMFSKDTRVANATKLPNGVFQITGPTLPYDSFTGDMVHRIPLMVISPFSRGGKVMHSYNDHASVVKFIERNWDLKPLTHRSRDNLPNPKMNRANPYVPANMPAVGDLFDMFDFDR
jgi:phospholipase C